jgi:hypothetical protein
MSAAVKGLYYCYIYITVILILLLYLYYCYIYITVIFILLLYLHYYYIYIYINVILLDFALPDSPANKFALVETSNKKYSKLLSTSFGRFGLATKTGANGEAAGGTRLRGMLLTHSHFCFGNFGTSPLISTVNSTSCYTLAVGLDISAYAVTK